MAQPLTVGACFDGIGGISRGLSRAGMDVQWQIEIDDRKRDVLARHWPDAKRYGDITQVQAADLEPVDLIAGGFPCQDLSHAGRRAGLEGQRSGLWAHLARLVGGLRPRYVLVENTTGILVRGMGRVLGDLAALGYDAEWDCIPAAAVGAPQLRARIWILAYPRGERKEADDTVFAGRPLPELCAGWPAEPDVGRVDDGLPGGMDRVQWLGDAVVPAIPEFIGRRVMEMATDRHTPDLMDRLQDSLSPAAEKLRRAGLIPLRTGRKARDVTLQDGLL
jgi:DNA (cytosine-5)-methyltransferase 1